MGNLSWTPPGAEERSVIVRPTRPHDSMYLTRYRQVGWLDANGVVFPLEGGAHISPAPFTALWIEVGTD